SLDVMAKSRLISAIAWGGDTSRSGAAVPVIAHPPFLHVTGTGSLCQHVSCCQNPSLPAIVGGDVDQWSLPGLLALCTVNSGYWYSRGNAPPASHTGQRSARPAR